MTAEAKNSLTSQSYSSTVTRYPASYAAEFHAGATIKSASNTTPNKSASCTFYKRSQNPLEFQIQSEALPTQHPTNLQVVPFKNVPS